jgi:hypothetical protein
MAVPDGLAYRFIWAEFAFGQWEDASLRYTGIDSHAGFSLWVVRHRGCGGEHFVTRGGRWVLVGSVWVPLGSESHGIRVLLERFAGADDIFVG